MLKKTRGLFLGLVVCAGSACVTPTHASSAQPVILTYVQAAGPTGAKEELIVLHNTTAVNVDMTDWCLVNKASVAFACFTSAQTADGEHHFILPPYSDATVASREYVTAHAMADESVSLIYTVTNQSSGSIVVSADTISLRTPADIVFDARMWTAAPPSGRAWTRLVRSFDAPIEYIINNDPSDWTTAPWAATAPVSGMIMVIVPVAPPDDTHEEEGAETSPVPTTTLSSMIITEIFPNAVGSDEGKEFIELYNPDPLHEQSLEGLRLRIGVDTAKWYTLPSIVVPPLTYVVFTDKDLGYSLVNTHGGVQLYQGDTPLGEWIEYSTPKEGESWSLIDNPWGYTNLPTPGAVSRKPFEATIAVADASLKVSMPKPCAANQYRNPETGRCKLLPTPKPATVCKEGQVINPETKRCRMAAVAKIPTPCKEDQERNPETGRCRGITKMSSVAYGVKGVQTKASASLSWYSWATIAIVILLILAYAIWEWRHELRAVWCHIRAVAKR